MTLNDNVIGWCNPLRPLAVDIPVGSLVAVSVRGGGCVAGRIEKIIHRPNGSVFGKFVAVPAGWTGRVRWDGHQRVQLLPQHYGVCVECGYLTPCPRQNMEIWAAELAAQSDPIAQIELAYRAQRGAIRVT
ncbi:hypothetical protein [Mycobacteroides abscessus]|uniref:hypothetical protein n=1 Tax=Mycobacteroides abscessus TaxID=36809 RepID=UPI0009A89106|nr:hypothetical protein [Mycobacteroides abscessus]SKO15721.1 Uncharacterised protein [Mycobacteroides abscessus subsp. bolletii]SKX37191.1 Uncharacterised protein [Mycobacteroides abscessus subsp. bolletii]